MRAYLVALALVISACGEDEAPPPPPRAPANAPAQPGAPAAGDKGKGKQLTPMKRIEERVSCPTPSDAKKCDPKAPLCEAGQFCIAAASEFYCGACPERDAIRHVFKPRDFQGADIRDPFHSVILQPGFGAPDGKVDTVVTPKCTRKEQFVATSSNYQTLKIIGIVSQGTQRKVLLTDGRIGHIVKKGDCVGKERAVVKDIGAGYITFAVEAVGKPDSAPAEYSMQLYPTQVSLTTPDAIDPGAASAPMIAPPGGVPAPAPEPPQGTTTTIIQQKPQTQQQTVEPPPQAPTQLKP